MLLPSVDWQTSKSVHHELVLLYNQVEATPVPGNGDAFGVFFFFRHSWLLCK